MALLERGRTAGRLVAFLQLLVLATRALRHAQSFSFTAPFTNNGRIFIFSNNARHRFGGRVQFPLSRRRATMRGEGPESSKYRMPPADTTRIPTSATPLPPTGGTATRDTRSRTASNIVGSVLLAAAVAASSAQPALRPCNAFDDTDYASETVTATVKLLDDAAGDGQKSFSAYEEVAKIITEGRGVGGGLSYGGVQLERGLVADEDTSIYNPGLTLLTESEKERLVDAVVRNRKAGLAQNAWSEDNQFGYEFLKQNLDPLHMAELKGYLGALPFVGAAVYLAALGVQQNARQFFAAAYVLGAVVVFAPIALLIALGP